MDTLEHATNCPFNAGFRTLRHEDVVKAILLQINDDKGPQPVSSKNGNLRDDT